MKHKTFWVSVAALAILLLLICTLPLIQRVEKTVQCVGFIDTANQGHVVKVELDGIKKVYLFRKNKLELGIMVSDYVADIKTVGPIHLEHDSIYSVTIVCYAHEENTYSFGTLSFNEDFSYLSITGINEYSYMTGYK